MKIHRNYFINSDRKAVYERLQEESWRCMLAMVFWGFFLTGCILGEAYLEIVPDYLWILGGVYSLMGIIVLNSENNSRKWFMHMMDFLETEKGK